MWTLTNKEIYVAKDIFAKIDPNVILKIQLLLYFHDGHRMSTVRNSDTPSKNWGIWGEDVCTQVIHRVIFTTIFLVGIYKFIIL
jgi:hypothetical protein